MINLTASAYDFELRAVGADIASFPDVVFYAPPMLNTGLRAFGRTGLPGEPVWCLKVRHRRVNGIDTRPKFSIYPADRPLNQTLTFRLPKRRLYRELADVMGDLERYKNEISIRHFTPRFTAETATVPMDELETLKMFNERRLAKLREATPVRRIDRKHNQYNSTEQAMDAMLRRLGQ